MQARVAYPLALAVALAAAHLAGAALELPSIIGDNMVLQRDAQAAVWGWDAPGTRVTVDFRDQTVEATAGADGKWLARVAAGVAGGPFPLRIRGTTEVSLGNVMVGEVWIAGGQSNMWWPLAQCRDAEKEIAAASDSDVRVWDANTGPRSAGWPADAPQRTVQTQWQVTSPATARSYPGVPYFFARQLRQKLQVPVGIVHLAVPGTPIEMFMSREGCDACPLVGADKPPEAGKEPRCAVLRNGMVLPAAPYTARGFIWWQGESNASRPGQYRALLRGLIGEWRALFENPDAPFLYVELHNFGNRVDGMQDAPWPALRDAQRAVLAVRNAHLVSVIDIKEDPPGEADWQIHPARKQIAGERLYRAALATAYGDASEVGFGPRFKAAALEGEAVLSFDHVGGGLTARGGGELRGFTLAGPDRVFTNGVAVLRGDTVVVTAQSVPKPAAVRYNWANHPVGNLVNREGLPACAFRTDDWELKMDK